MVAHIPDRSAVAQPRVAFTPRTVTIEKLRNNWVLYVFIFFLPLQNLQTGYMPNLGGGLNFLNIGFAVSLLGALYCKGKLSHWSSVHPWVLAYVGYAVFSLFVGYSNVSSETED